MSSTLFSDLKMGRRKSKRKPGPKKKNIEPLDILFNCPFCNHEKSCEVQGGQLNMAVCFWYLVKGVHVLSIVYWTSHFLQGTRKSWPYLSGRVVPGGIYIYIFIDHLN